MEIPEMFIVSVECEKVSADMEIPSAMPMSEVRSRILDVLKNVYAGNFSTWSGCKIIYRNRILTDKDTLEKIGAFDGSRLVVVNSSAL